MHKLKLVQQIFEARYERGYRYLDRTGEAMLILEDLLPSETGKVWMPDEIVPSGARLKCPDLDLNVTFDTYRLAIDQNPAGSSDEFANVSRLLLTTLTARFDLRSFVRAGWRRIFTLPTDSVEEAELLSVKAFPIKSWPVEPPSGMKMVSCEATAVVEDADGTGYRFVVRPMSKVDAPIQPDPRLRLPPRLQHKDQREALIEQLKRQAQRDRDPVAGVHVDIDYYQVRPAKLDIAQFFQNGKETTDRLASEFAQRNWK